MTMQCYRESYMLGLPCIAPHKQSLKLSHHLIVNFTSVSECNGRNLLSYTGLINSKFLVQLKETMTHCYYI